MEYNDIYSKVVSLYAEKEVVANQSKKLAKIKIRIKLIIDEITTFKRKSDGRKNK